MKFSIVLTTYNRPRQLRYCLESIRRQQIQSLDHEILVIDDGTDKDSQGVAESFNEWMNIRYIHTGCRTNGKWRNMGFTANIGIRQAAGEIVALTNSDIYQLGTVVAPVIQQVERDRMALSSVHEVYDDDGTLIEYLHRGDTSPEAEKAIVDRIAKGPRPPGVYPANPDIPFFLAIRREHLLRLGAYDEDFIGCASEDCDLLDRLKTIGCHYVYAPPGAEAIHLYHGRRAIKELEADPGFAYNIRLRKQREDILVRNQDKPWGELIDPNVPEDGSPMHLVLWVTSKCNLDCPLCNQQITRRDQPNYEMSRKELLAFIDSCRQRRIHFRTIELTGGEPTLWPLFEWGIHTLKDSGIADTVTFITNGHDAKRVAEIANRYGLYYVVSKSQCMDKQAAIHQQTGVGVIWNRPNHRPIPDEPVLNSLPALCSQRRDMDGRVVRQLFYIKGIVWYCCGAYVGSRLVGDDSIYQCPFEQDFDSYFHTRADNLAICQVCLCNKKVWDKMGDGREGRITVP